jgi:hypothetical protein
LRQPTDYTIKQRCGDQQREHQQDFITFDCVPDLLMQGYRKLSFELFFLSRDRKIPFSFDRGRIGFDSLDYLAFVTVHLGNQKAFSFNAFVADLLDIAPGGKLVYFP